jgi:hypothetical protein
MLACWVVGSSDNNMMLSVRGRVFPRSAGRESEPSMSTVTRSVPCQAGNVGARKVGLGVALGGVRGILSPSSPERIKGISGAGRP